LCRTQGRVMAESAQECTLSALSAQGGRFVSTEIGEFSDYWPIQRFDSLFSVQQGKQVSKNNRVGENQRPFLRTRNLFWGRFDLSELDKMHFTGTDENRLALEPGDLLICEGGDIGRSAIWRGELPYCYYQNHLHRARLKDPSVADQEFVLYWLWYAFKVGSVYFGRGNVTTIPNLSQSKLCELPLPVPPLDEQRKIAAILGTVQRAIEEQERLLRLTTELKKSLLHQLFTEGLRGEPQKMTEIGPVPESWEVKPIGEYLTEAQYGISAKGSESGSYAVLRMTNQIQGRISSQNLQYVDLTLDQFQKFRVEREDILFNRTNSFDLVGRTAIFDLEGDFVFASYLIRMRTIAERLRPFFLNHYFNWEDTQLRLKSIATRAISQSNISASRLRGFLVPVPRPEEQTEIVEKLEYVDQKSSIHARKHTILANLFRTLLHQLMTARIRVDNLDLSNLKGPVGDHA
jgi:type I restriction enzyme S subunit